MKQNLLKKIIVANQAETASRAAKKVIVKNGATKKNIKITVTRNAATNLKTLDS